MSVTFYERRLINEVEIQRELSGGLEYPHGVTLRFSNADGYFTDLWAAGEEFRGKIIRLTRYEPNETDSADVLLYELSGVVTDFNILLDIAEFTVTVQDPDPLQVELPNKVYEITDWAQTPPQDINPTADLGKPYSLVFGRAKKVPLRYVHANYTSDYYDYIICKTGSNSIESNNSNKASTVVVYRNKVIVSAAEYTVYDGSQSSPYAGYAFIRFVKEQRDYTGNLYEICADVRGLKLYGDATATRNFAKVIRCLLSDSTLGLGLSINSASFAQAASDTAALLCDGFIGEQTTAQDIINELLDMCGGVLSVNESQERVIEIDKYKPVVAATFGHNDGWYNNIIEISNNKALSTTETVKAIALNYRLNAWANSYSQKNTRNVMPFGEDMIIDASFVRDHETADRITCLKQRLYQYGDKRLEITVGMEGRFLKRFDPVKIIIPQLKIDAIYQVRGVTRSINKFALSLIRYSQDIYIYQPDTPPPDENEDAETDYSNTPPAQPTSLTKVSQGVAISLDGMSFAYVELSADASEKNFARMFFGYRKQGETLPYAWVVGEVATGLTWKGSINGLVPGISYQFAAVSENNYGLRSSLATLNSQTAPGDTTLPAQVTGLTGRGKYKTWEFSWTANTTDKDLRGYRVQIGNSSFSAIYFDRIVDQNKASYTDDARDYGTLYCRVKAVDYTGNESASWSSTASATTDKTHTDDVDDDQITYLKRQQVNSVSYQVSGLGANGYGTFTVTHNLGRVPVGVACSGQSIVVISVVSLTTTQAEFLLVNLLNTAIGNFTITLYYW